MIVLILFFSFALYPAFFIVLYAAGEYLFPTKNGAMIFAALSGIIISAAYYYIRTKIAELKETKRKKKADESTLVSQLMLLDPARFSSFFPKNALCDNSFSGINEEKVLRYLREHGLDSKAEIYSLKGLTPGAEDLLKLLNVKYALHQGKEILSAAENEPLPKIKTVRAYSRLNSILRVLTGKKFMMFSLKYGIILLLLSLITPYKAYYIIFGSLLFSYGAFLTFFRKK